MKIIIIEILTLEVKHYIDFINLINFLPFLMPKLLDPDRESKNMQIRIRSTG